MNYLVVKNKGLIEAEDLYLIGSSTKREDETKIGMFGSGWKFALAWLMRNDCLPKIFSGENEIQIGYNIVKHRDNDVKVITINGKETSLTSEMGLKWNGWMALREIISNAIDEGQYEVNTIWNPNNFDFESEKTTIYIPMNNELSEVLRSYDNYFSFERKASFENEVGRVYIKTSESKMAIYRKGIRCYDSEIMGLIDFDFNEIEINESRLCRDIDINISVNNLVKNGVSTIILKKILEDGFQSYLRCDVDDNILSSLKELIDSGEVFTCPSIQGIGGMLLVKNPTLAIPNDWFTKLADLGLIENPFQKFKDTGAPKDFVRTDVRDVKGIKYYLEGLNLKYNFFTGLFNGDVVVSENNVYINDKTYGSDKEMASLIMYRSSRDYFESQLN